MGHGGPYVINKELERTECMDTNSKSKEGKQIQGSLISCFFMTLQILVHPQNSCYVYYNWNFLWRQMRVKLYFWCKGEAVQNRLLWFQIKTEKRKIHSQVRHTHSKRGFSVSQTLNVEFGWKFSKALWAEMISNDICVTYVYWQEFLLHCFSGFLDSLKHSHVP